MWAPRLTGLKAKETTEVSIAAACLSAHTLCSLWVPTVLSGLGDTEVNQAGRNACSWRAAAVVEGD